MPVKFYTYAPGKGPGAIKLAAGQTLRFQEGKGYYAGPKAAAPAPAPYMYSSDPASSARRAPAFTPRAVAPRKPAVVPAAPARPVDPYAALAPGAIDTQAAGLAQAGLTPQQDEVRRQQALAAARATADETAITGFQTAAGALMGQIAPMVGQGYRDAAKTVGDIGTGVGGQVGADLAAEQAAGDAFAASQGQSGGHTNDPAATGSTVGYLGGQLPGESLAAQGAAAQERAARDVQIPLSAGREELSARMAQAADEGDQYAQQLIQLAAQFPGLKAQALQQLNTYELDKANYRDSLRVHTEQIASSKADTIRQNRAEIANEAAANVNTQVDAAYKAAEMKYKWAGLQFKSQEAVAKAKAAAAQGRRMDVGASRARGHVVYQNGTEDPSLKVKGYGSSTDPSVKAKVNRQKAKSKASKDGYDYAYKILGKPTLVTAQMRSDNALGGTGKKMGKFVAGPHEKTVGKGAVFGPAFDGAPATTNNALRADRTGAGAVDYNDAQNKVYQEIGGESLEKDYGYSHEEVLTIVNRALVTAGWRRIHA